MIPLVSIAIAASFMAAIGLVLAAVLALANKRLAVVEDPRIDQVEDLLPHANCGACGTPGCRAFAEQLVAGQARPGQCSVNSKEMNRLIANFLGVDVGNVEKRVARLACAGGNHVARSHARYSGLDTCRAATLVSGGGKGCVWGCLGFGDCGEVCDFDAITMDRQRLPVVDAVRCTACGDCVEACPADARTLAGRTMTIDELVAEIDRDRVFIERSGGGVTFSGGEPLMQPEFLREAIAACRTQGWHTAVETSGYGTPPAMAAAATADLVLFDLKVHDEA